MFTGITDKVFGSLLNTLKTAESPICFMCLSYRRNGLMARLIHTSSSMLLVITSLRYHALHVVYPEITR